MFDRKKPSPILAPLSRLVGKHELNPPVVTIFGAGISGLTAAHELVERGFRVFVVEREEDCEWPGRCLIGGMAASQYGRVRPSVELLHRSLLTDQNEGPLKDINQWLLLVFLSSRNGWLQSGAPLLLPLVKPGEDPDPFAFAYFSGAAYEKSLNLTLHTLKTERRRQWVWDLIWRSFHIGYADQPGKLGTLPPRTEDDARRDGPAARALGDFERSLLNQAPLNDRQAAELEAFMKACGESPVAADADDLRILACLVTSGTIGPDDAQKRMQKALASDGGDELRRHMAWAMSREILCIRATPCWCPPDVTDVARAKMSLDDLTKASVGKLEALEGTFKDWVNHNHLLASFEFEQPPTPFSRESAKTRGCDAGDVWLELSIIEEKVAGEHGYRFFPSFYKHLDDTLRRIPVGNAGRTVADNLKPTEVQGLGIGVGDGPMKPRKPVMVEFARTPPLSFTELWDNTIGFVKAVGGTVEDAALFHAKIFEFLTTSKERRRSQYQKETWRDFIELERYSAAMREHLSAAAQALLAFSVAEADAYSYGNVVVQILLDNVKATGHVDRTLNGPTTEALLRPWQTYLENEGVTFVHGELVDVTFQTEGSAQELRPTIRYFDHSQPDRDLLEKADFYVMALSVAATRRLVNAAFEAHQKADLAQKIPLGDEAKDFVRFQAFWKNSQFEEGDGLPLKQEKSGPLRHMTGMQFFFDGKTRVGQGHVYYPFSDWGLSTISQSEFWKRRLKFTDGYLGVLSIDLCDLTCAAKGKKATSKTFVEVLEKDGRGERSGKFFAAIEVWRQLAERIVPPVSPDDPPEAVNGTGIEFPRFFHLDRGLVREEGGEWINKTPFMATTPESWEVRPGQGDDGRIAYEVNFNRWLLCGTHAATHTRLTTMEAANESGRHAVRAILRKLDDSTGAIWRKIKLDGYEGSVYFGEQELYNGASAARAFDFPAIFPLEDREPPDLGPLKRIDRELFERSLPHAMEILRVPDRIRLAFLGYDLAADTVGLSALRQREGQEGPRQAPLVEAGVNLFKEANRQWRDLFGGDDVAADLQSVAVRVMRELQRLSGLARGGPAAG
jgi:uncharacterized protein with NAD-binding domain and iron-sulfur cluster